MMNFRPLHLLLIKCHTLETLNKPKETLGLFGGAREELARFSYFEYSIMNLSPPALAQGPTLSKSLGTSGMDIYA